MDLQILNSAFELSKQVTCHEAKCLSYKRDFYINSCVILDSGFL